MHPADDRDLLKATAITLAVALLALWLLTGCTPRERSLTTGEVIPAAQLPLAGFKPDTHYAVVRLDALPAINDTFRDALFRVSGLSRWDARYDCNHFAALYIATAQARYAAAAWHSDTTAQTLALGEVWFRKNGDGPGHAIVAAVTDRGLVFIEPQTGGTITLTNAEQMSRYFTRW